MSLDQVTLRRVCLENCGEQCAGDAYMGRRQGRDCAYLRGVIRQRQRVMALEARYAKAIFTEFLAEQGESIVPTGYADWPDSMKAGWLKKQNLMSTEELTEMVGGAGLATKGARGARAGAKAIGPAGNAGAFPRISATTKQLEKKFKHAASLGVTEARGAAGFKAFARALDDFVAAEGTVRTLGTYRKKTAILSFNRTTGQVVVQSPTGKYVTNYTMTPAQLRHVQQTGNLGGG